MRFHSPLLIVTSVIAQAFAACEPEIPFPPPQYTAESLTRTVDQIDAAISALAASGRFNNTAVSVEVASREQALYSFHRSGLATAETVNGSSAYRIASNTKLFTALGILQAEAAGKLSLDDRITKFISGLSGDASSRIAWEDITLRTLMSHMSGIPDNYAEDDLILSLSDPTVLGLPPIVADKAALPACEGFSNYTQPCSKKDLLQYLQDAQPVFPAKVEPSYSNVGFDLLGQVLANISNTTYEQYIDSTIIRPLNLTGTSFTPPAANGVLVDDSYWGVDLGVGNPSGGLYSTPADMITFLRFALANHNTLTPALNWFQPAAYSSGAHSYLGYPWEIFRSPAILPNSTRTVTINTKGGGLAGYYTYSFVIPGYDIVVFMAAAGDLTVLNELLDVVVDPVIVGAEEVAQMSLNTTYAGTYLAPVHTGLKSSVTISHSMQKSLYVASWTSNSTDVLGALIPLVAAQAGTGENLDLELIPTFEIRADADGRVGEVWRFINVMEGNGGDTETQGNATSIWADYCVSNIDPLSYAGTALNEAVFWKKNETSPVTQIELSAFRVVLERDSLSSPSNC
ncbi:serine hydrolase domain-containing protein [Aspergillus homomorphus CBS 101889]|uniref:Beta-lactamase/transpeptidase-like protein n=1 Tax=Aspergillus homomorphus (strain CBS 101889) TaxID=1450537 RepID=A0A395HNS9_ASPHC|nr:beta-lactamase/transpeptidase-like protein [Aspergillus homomorphus CBS 101889]RAL09612.1 beta-lactamase/transpeptidase-like protein [Aspergillus homomorphus CBS 101889]